MVTPLFKPRANPDRPFESCRLPIDRPFESCLPIACPSSRPPQRPHTRADRQSSSFEILHAAPPPHRPPRPNARTPGQIVTISVQPPPSSRLETSPTVPPPLAPLSPPPHACPAAVLAPRRACRRRGRGRLQPPQPSLSGIVSAPYATAEDAVPSTLHGPGPIPFNPRTKQALARSALRAGRLGRRPLRLKP
ncbi:hypothetical protein PVAP13_4KG086400 [Panicum virgatum]|uniref:Uncharacterized protein n=1 Tax=Panicum virgatum TaxID=38727 RepID=A0A8T0TDI2_PANVG|nr:hypothetical protein PVAP13_4KG086400 [Panicum virgatum]